MALRFIDSMAHYATGQLGRKWTFDGGATVVSSGGDRNAPYLNLSGTPIWKTLTPQSNYIQGVRASVFPGTFNIMTVYANGGTMGSLNCFDDGTLGIMAAGNTIYISTLAVSDPSDWHYYEVEWNVSGVVNATFTGSNTLQGTLWVDSSLWGTFSGTSNQAYYPWYTVGQTSAMFNQLGHASSQYLHVMDEYVVDTNGTDINSKFSTLTSNLGDVEIDALFPDQDILTNWGSFGGDGTHAYSCVNETTPDDDTSYVFTTATGSAEAFEYQPISTFTGTILGAQYLVCAKKTAEGARGINLTWDGNDLVTSNFLTANNYLSDYYIYYIAPMDSALGTAWTTAVFNTSTFGVTLAF
jgi:hypothetical protein